MEKDRHMDDKAAGGAQGCAIMAALFPPPVLLRASVPHVKPTGSKTLT